MRRLPVVVGSRCGVVTGAELAAVGWSRDAVRHALTTGRLERVARGCFAPAPSDHLNRFARADLRLLRRAVAATLRGDRVAVSHLAAALSRGWPVWTDDPHACVTTWDPRVCRLDGVHVHRVATRDIFVRREGVPVTSATRTIVDIAREFGGEAALVPADVALRLGAITPGTLAEEIGRSAGLPGVEAARRIVDLLDPRSESPLESRSRWHFDAHGIDPPQSQVLLHDLDGRFLGRVDHYWSEGVVGEADGALKYRDDPRALVNEKVRQQLFEDCDLEVTRWAAVDLRDFRAAAARIERARARARRRLLAQGPRWIATPMPDPVVRRTGPVQG